MYGCISLLISLNSRRLPKTLSIKPLLLMPAHHLLQMQAPSLLLCGSTAATPMWETILSISQLSWTCGNPDFHYRVSRTANLKPMSLCRVPQWSFTNSVCEPSAACWKYLMQLFYLSARMISFNCSGDGRYWRCEIHLIGLHMMLLRTLMSIMYK